FDVRGTAGAVNKVPVAFRGDFFKWLEGNCRGPRNHENTKSLGFLSWLRAFVADRHPSEPAKTSSLDDGAFSLPFPFAELDPPDLPGLGPRQRVNELDLARVLVRRELALDVILELGDERLARLDARLEHDDGFRHEAAHGI